MHSFHLTSIYPIIACFGSSFKSTQHAIDYATELQYYGLCLEFTIGCFHQGKFTEFYRTI